MVFKKGIWSNFFKSNTCRTIGYNRCSLSLASRYLFLFLRPLTGAKEGGRGEEKKWIKIPLNIKDLSFCANDSSMIKKIGRKFRKQRTALHSCHFNFHQHFYMCRRGESSARNRLLFVNRKPERYLRHLFSALQFTFYNLFCSGSFQWR